jgi:magnesium-transporting ATPase (P-type)
MVRVLGSCEAMANASVICTGKTKTLTQNKMTVVAGTVGVHATFIRRLEDIVNGQARKCGAIQNEGFRCLFGQPKHSSPAPAEGPL